MTDGGTRVAGPLRGLIVVDQEVEGLLFARFLSAAGHRVDVALSHVRAEAVLARAPVEYLLVDVDFLGDRRLSFAWAGAHAGDRPVVFISSLHPDEISFPPRRPAWSYLRKDEALAGGRGRFVAAVEARVRRPPASWTAFDRAEVPFVPSPSEPTERPYPYVAAPVGEGLAWSPNGAYPVPLWPPWIPPVAGAVTPAYPGPG